jgi:hypothetical protein
MKKILLITCMLVSHFIAAAQETEATTVPNKSFIAELGGPGLLFSANFDTRFKKQTTGLGARIGLGFVSAWESIYDTTWGGYYSEKMRSVLTVPFQLNYLFGKPNSVHALEVGLGITYVGKKLDIMDFYDEEQSNLFGTASFMYRRLPKNGGFSWRLGFTPLFTGGYIQPFGAASVGYNF